MGKCALSLNVFNAICLTLNFSFFSFQMPRNYLVIHSYSLELHNAALHEIRVIHRKIREVERNFWIPEFLLLDRPPDLKPLCCRPLFWPETELELKEHILRLCNLFYALTRKELRRLVFKYAELCLNKHKFNIDTRNVCHSYKQLLL